MCWCEAELTLKVRQICLFIFHRISDIDTIVDELFEIFVTRHDGRIHMGIGIRFVCPSSDDIISLVAGIDERWYAEIGDQFVCTDDLFGEIVRSFGSICFVIHESIMSDSLRSCISSDDDMLVVLE